MKVYENITIWQVLFPESVVLVCLNWNIGGSRLPRNFGTMLDMKLFSSSAHLPHFIIVFVQSSLRTNTFDLIKDGQAVRIAIMFCWCCSEEAQFLSLNCSYNIISCAERQIPQVPWLKNLEPTKFIGNTFVRENCPISLSSKHGFCPEEVENLMCSAVAHTNKTALGGTWVKQTVRDGLGFHQ